CLVAAADEALYEAKHHGRNQIRLRILIGDQDRRLRQLAMQRRFSRWLVQHELLDIPTVSRALLQCPADHVRIGELAQRQRILDDEQVRQILHDQRQNGERFGEVGLRLGLLTEEQLTYLLALQQENPRALAIAIARLGLLNPQAVTESLERYLKETVPQPETVPG
ncbi:MAG TPA: hypothetical protein VF175_03265, partial [Lacipirellula sp.]